MSATGQRTGLHKTPGDSLTQGDDKSVYVIHSILLHPRNILMCLFAFFKSNKKPFWVSFCYQTRQISSFLKKDQIADIFQLKKKQSIFLCRVPTYLMLICVFFFLHFKCHPTMEKDFCQALIDDDRKALQPMVNAFLGTLDVQESMTTNYLKIQNWIENYDCVDTVELMKGTLRSRYPIKVFRISLTDENNNHFSRDFFIRIYPEKMIFDNK